MKNLIYSLILIVFVSFTVAAQELPSAPDNDAPIDWKLYSISSTPTSVMFPKMPLRLEKNDLCNQLRSSAFYAYAKQAIYELDLFTKAHSIPGACYKKSRFGQETLDRRIAELKGSSSTPVSVTESEIAGHKAVVFTSSAGDSTRVRWLIEDMANERWRELAITYRSDEKPEREKFVNSLLFDGKKGVDMSVGSTGIIGDKPADIRTKPDDPMSTYGLVLLAKPKPPYTEMARQNEVQGTVILHAVFLANGSIGAISVVKALPFGLTEQAVAAARRLVFLPARAKGVPVTVAKQIEYSFSIY